MSGGSPTFSLPCPPSPVMLYIGAGYDLSPLLKFAPGGPPYPIVPLSEQGHPRLDTPFTSPHVYTSFLFVDAKPRFTSAFMVSDFHEWTTLEARVRNVLHYAQGSLSRWRTVPGAPDLLWFEGGGDAALVDSRSRDPSWVFPDPAPPRPSCLGSSSSPRPLTTLLYLFNTLDVELVRAPLLAPVWPHVEALYVHGLRLHIRTGAGMGLGGHPVPNANMSTGIDAVCRRTLAGLDDANLQSQLGTGLKRCYVIVGSWGTPLRKPQSKSYKGSRAQGTEDDTRPKASMGIRHVDFVSEAWSKWKAEARKSAEVVGRRQHSNDARSCLPPSISPPLISSSPSLPSSPTPGSLISSSVAINTTLHLQTHVSPISPLIFRRPRVRHSVLTHQGWHSDDMWDSDYDGDSEDVYTDTNGSEDEDRGGIAESTLSPRISGPFHVRIPQLAWSSTLRGGHGGYFVEKTVEESIAFWRAREGRRAGESEEDESATEPEFNSEEAGKRDEVVPKKKRAQYLYNFRSFFSIRAQTSLTSPARVLPVNRPSVTPRSRMPPPRSRPRLRPRPPTPAPDSEETESENSASETVFGMSHCGGDASGEACECECQRLQKSGVTYQMGMGSEKENVASGIWRRRFRARRGLADFNARTAVCDTRAMTMTKSKARSMSQMDRDVLHLPVPATVPVVDAKSARTTSHVASRHWRNLSSKSLDAPPNIPKHPSGFSPQIKSRERRIDIADFLSTTSDPNTCDTVRCVSSIDTFDPASISDAGPVRFSSDTACDSLAIESAPAISNFYHTQVTPASSSFLSTPLSPASLSTTFPRSPYCPSDLFDNSNLEQDSRVRPSKKWRPSILPFWAKTKQQRENKYRVEPMSGLFGWKMPVTHNRNARPPPGFPSPPSSPHKSPCCPHKAHKAACINAQSHNRARTTHRFRFDPDAPPVPPLPSHFRGHAHTRSMFDPPVHRETHPPYSHIGTHTSTSPNVLSSHSPSLTATDHISGQSINTPSRQSEESDKTRIGV